MKKNTFKAQLGIGALVLALAGIVDGASLHSSASAQQALQGGGQGSGSGGTSGGVAAPRGSGQGGTTAGGTNGSGASGTTGTGPGGVNQNRFGGGATPPPPPPAPVNDSTVTFIMQLLQGSAQGGESVVFPDRCAYSAPGRLTAQQRISGENAEYLAAAQYVLAPNYNPGESRTALVLLANYQEELEQREPDSLVAASYLGLTATRPVTIEVVARVNALLCVTSTEALAEQIATLAEAHREASKPAAR